MSNRFQYRLHVHPRELDLQGHVNNVEFVRWMQDAAVAHISSLGWTTKRHLANGLVWVAHTHSIRYHAPAFSGDSIRIETWVANMRKVRSLRKYKIYRETDDTLLAAAETDWALMRVSDQKPTRIPREIAELFVTP